MTANPSQADRDYPPVHHNQSDEEDRNAQALAAEVQRLKEESKPLTLDDLADPLPEQDNPNAIFKNGYLRRGHGMALIAPAGVGKSTLSIQTSIQWCMGMTAFGIDPVKPLNVAIIQAEDDQEEMAFFRNEITRGLLAEGCHKSDIIKARKKILIYEFVGLVGEAFCARLKLLLKDNPELDLVIINPLQSYAGCDISHNAELTKFLRVMLDPVIKNSHAAVLFIHHTNKPPNAKERSGWGTDSFAAYAGAGGAELANWTRAQLSLVPVEGMTGVFTLTAGKRGGRLGWKDSDGEKTTRQYIAHSDGLIFWRSATDEEILEAEGQSGKKRISYDVATDAEELAKKFRAKTTSITEARIYSDVLLKRTRSRLAFEYLKSNLEAFNLCISQPKKNGASFIGNIADSEALLRAQDGEATGKPEIENALLVTNTPSNQGLARLASVAKHPTASAQMEGFARPASIPPLGGDCRQQAHRGTKQVNFDELNAKMNEAANEQEDPDSWEAIPI